MDGQKLKAKIIVETIRFYNEESNWGIITFSVSETMEENEVKGLMGTNVAKGIMPSVMVGGEYCLEAKEVHDPKWGVQYDILKIYTSLLLNEDDKKGQRAYLETLFTKGQVDSMYEALENPYEAFKQKDIASLVKVKGCGFKTAGIWLERFVNNLEKSRIFVELSDYGFSSTMAKKLLEHYKTPDLVIQTVKNTPYSLIDVPGIGWVTCDTIAMKGGLSKHCPERVEAYLKYFFRSKAEEGYSYLYADDQLMPELLLALGDDLPDESILEALKRLEPKLWWNEDRTAVGLKYYLDIESRIAKKLIELRNAPNKFEVDDWEKIVHEKELKQGWQYTEQQFEGIKAVLENQVVIITGYGGTGKSSIVAGVIEVLKNYRFAQCALSGRAASRLAEVTGDEGYTIHRLLGYPKGEESKGKFEYHENCLLPYDIIIVDEISMVNGEIFWALIRAMMPGTKLVLLGDVGQLESIGCSNIANDMISSPEIKSVVLDKIHRQAAASAIITDSIAARNGKQIIAEEYAGVETRGKLQDLTYDCYSDANNTFIHVLEWVAKLNEMGISMMDTQVITPIKERQAGTWNLNLALQEIYNPLKPGEKELLVSYGETKKSYFRKGDKVINIKNNYKAREYVGQWKTNTKEEAKDMGSLTPIFNGNMGIVVDANLPRKEMIVDFIGIGKVLITIDMLRQVMLGYAITVHKCQGSEFPYVIFGMDFSGYTLLSRQMVYTAITRASKHCYVVAQNSSLRYAITQNKVIKKQTILQDELYKAAHPVF